MSNQANGLTRYPEGRVRRARRAKAHCHLVEDPRFCYDYDNGECPTPGLQYLSLEWHELRADGTPKNCTTHDLEDPAGVDARHNCGRVVIEPGATATLVKLKYGKTYSFKTTAFFDLGLAGPSSTVISEFTGSLTANHPATDYALSEIQANTLASTCTDNIVTPGRPRANTFAVTSDREVNYYQKDHLGTTRIVANEGGVILSTHDYEPFGLELPPESFVPNTHRFTGHERDTETGLDYMKARYYGARMGRFSSSDENINSIITPITLTWNRYSYTRNSPIKYLDNTGYKEKPPTFDQANYIFLDFNSQTLLPRDGGPPNPSAYNCHSLTFNMGRGEPQDKSIDKASIQLDHPLWDNSAVNNLVGMTKLGDSERNEVGDVVIYWKDSNGDGNMQNGEITHSGTVIGIDSEGNTVAVYSKLGDKWLAVHHPGNAKLSNDTKEGYGTHRVYYRRNGGQKLMSPKVPDPSTFTIAPVTEVGRVAQLAFYLDKSTYSGKAGGKVGG